VLGTLAHETMHAIDFLYAKQQNLQEAFWRVEAMGAWAEDLVYGSAPTNFQTEQPYAFWFFTETARVGSQRLPLPLLPLDEIGNLDDEESDNAYSKYLFFQYLKKKFGDTDQFLPERILQREANQPSLRAIDAALAGHGGMRDVWHDYIGALWNDHEHHVKDEFYVWDALPIGMRTMFDRREGGWEPLDITSPGAAQPAPTPVLTNTLGIEGEGAYVPAVAGHWELLRLPDNSSSFVVFDRRLRLDGRFERVRALIKINGQWQAPVDWSAPEHDVEVWCRDKHADRIEEIALLFSNSGLPPTLAGVDPRIADWKWYDEDDLTPLHPRLIATNAGCWKWKGTTTVSIVGQGDGAGPFQGLSQNNRVTTSIAFEMSPAFLKHAALSTLGSFELAASVEDESAPLGTAEYQVTGTRNDGCTFRGGPETRPIAAGTGGLLIVMSRFSARSDAPANPDARKLDLVGMGDPPDMTISCPDEDAVTFPMPFTFWSGATFGSGAKLGDDGHTVSGSFLDTNYLGIPMTTQVSLTAERE
jgi:hypothetical protein